MGASLNADMHPYAKYNFTGNKECKVTYDYIEAQGKKDLKPLMTKEEWEELCSKRRWVHYFDQQT